MSEWEELENLIRRLIRSIEHLIHILEEFQSPTTTLHLVTKEGPMANFQLTAGDSVVVTVTDTDNVTGAVVTPDAGSVTAVLSSTSDTLTPNADGTFTITAGTVLGTGNTITVNATVNASASTPGVGTYDVVAAAPDATTLSVSFGTETAPAAPNVGTAVGQISPTTGLVNT